MRALRILYLGVDSGTCRHRALTLERLGHDVTAIDPRKLLPHFRAFDYWNHHTGGLGLERWIERKVLAAIEGRRFDVIYVDAGELLSPSLVKALTAHSEVLISFNIDDPFGGRDGHKWRLYRKALSSYDLAVVVRECNVSEAYAAGARNVLHVYRAADEVAHAPRSLNAEEARQWSSEVSFIGTWMPERSPLMAGLVELGVPLAIYGDRWQKAKEWPLLSSRWRGPGLYGDDQYRCAILGSKVCLGLLSRGNRDLSTQRSFEIPYLGGVFCAERTAEHLALYREGEEALFWNTTEECAEQCRRLLGDESLRLKLATNGRKRCIQNRTVNEAMMGDILATALGARRQERSLPAA